MLLLCDFWLLHVTNGLDYTTLSVKLARFISQLNTESIQCFMLEDNGCKELKYTLESNYYYKLTNFLFLVHP